MSHDDAIHVQFSREGGFTGVGLTADVDSRSLSPEYAERLRRLIEAADFFNLPARSKSQPGADRFQYRLAVELGGHRKVVQIGDGSVPESLQPLIDFLTGLAKSSRSTSL
jgi:emfourin